MKTTRTGIAIAALPSLLMLCAFYSLAIHMHLSLGAWPTSIGTNGFSQCLVVHGELAWDFCFYICFGTVLMVPVGIVLILLVRRWRWATVYCALHTLFFALAWGLMLLAPSRFLYWWWD